MRRILVNPHRNDHEIRKYTQVIESKVPHKVDFSLAATDRGTSVSSVAWSSEGNRELTITKETLASGVAQASLSANYSGECMAKVVATYADGEPETQYIRIVVTNPEYGVWI